MVLWIHMNGPENAPLEHAGEMTPLEIGDELTDLVSTTHEHADLAALEKNLPQSGVSAAGPHVTAGNGDSIDSVQFEKPAHENVYDQSKYRRMFNQRKLEQKGKQHAA